MHLENIDLPKEYTRLVEEKLFCSTNSFENTPRKIEFFHPGMKISREQILPEQEIMDETSVNIELNS